MKPRAFVLLTLCAATTVSGAQAPASPPELVRHLVRPDSADTSIHRFTEPDYVVFARGVRRDAPLLVFMPGTGGVPVRTSDFADVAARQGYRVIGLEYNDVPAVAQICPRDPDPRCSERVRQKRIHGDDVTNRIDDRPEESITARLVSVLLRLDHLHPDEAWGQYLQEGGPAWPRIAVSGLSQGAGMAAFIAHETRVARVVLFSSPWDNYGPRHTLAPWLHGPGATPSELWFGVYHEREPTAALIARAYSALGIPDDHVRVLRLDPAPSAPPGAFHPSVVGNGSTPRTAEGLPAYLDDWRFMLGEVR